MKYRKEIDGLRAIAVIPVILFHAGFSLFSGGYVGVDVFFVISGYLITCILIDDICKDEFSIGRFYERRARRILPALFFVMLCCIPFAWMWMLPSAFKDLSQSIVAVTLFSSNILFFRRTDYFAPDAELEPLLHTWSLAVEEQYYLIFPILLILGWKIGQNRLFWAICAIALISLFASEWGSHYKPAATFYLAPTRVWELLIGSICAFLLHNSKLKSNNYMAILGLTLILFSIFFYDNSTRFPGIFALVPVLGTALIILFATERTLVSSILSMRALVFIGLISYSAYLWHQPLFAFARIRSILAPSPLLMASLAFCSLVLAYLSWRYVEMPFRTNRGTILTTRRAVFVSSAVVAAFFLAIGLAGHFGGGFENRFDRDALKFQLVKKDKGDGTCDFGRGRRLPVHPEKDCLNLFDDSSIVFLLGDSHARSVSAELKRAMSREHISYYDMNYGGCVPFVGLRRFDRSIDHLCNDFNKGVLDFARKVDANTLVFTARFPWYVDGYSYDNGEGGVENANCAIVDIESRTSSSCNDPIRRLRVLRAYRDSIKELSKSFNIVLVYPIPEAGWNVPDYIFKRYAYDGYRGNVSTSYAKYKERSADVVKLFDELVEQHPNVFAARVDASLCSEQTGRCINADLNAVYYRDDDHLSSAGARLVAPVILEAIRRANAGAQ